MNELKSFLDEINQLLNEKKKMIEDEKYELEIKLKQVEKNSNLENSPKSKLTEMPEDQDPDKVEEVPILKPQEPEPVEPQIFEIGIKTTKNKTKTTKFDDKENQGHSINIQNTKERLEPKPQDPFSYYDAIKEGNQQTQIKNNTRRSNENEMDDYYITDKFYSYFPSMNNNEKEKKQSLLRQRNLEYQEYLKHIPETASTTKTKLTSTPTEEPVKLLEQSPLSKTYIKSTKDSPQGELTSIINFEDVEERNKREQLEKQQKKMEYQRELVKQIEMKRAEIEKMREKEKREEEALTRRLQQQLKTMELEEKLEQEKIRSEKIRIQNEKNHIARMQLLSKLENDYRLYNSGEDERKSFSENGKDIYTGPEDLANKRDDQIYRFFTNSARHDNMLVKHNLGKHKKSSNSQLSESNYSSGYELDVYTKPACKNCGKSIEETKDIELPDCFLCYWRNNKEKKFCHHCWYHFRSIVEDGDERPIRHERAIDTVSHPKPIVVSRIDDQPYSMNLEPNSIFNPDYSPEMPDLHKIKEMSDERISNYAKHYGDLRSKAKTKQYKSNPDYPVKKFKRRPKKDTKIQKIRMQDDLDEETEDDPNVLVQLGSIRKQLQLENLRIDNSN